MRPQSVPLSWRGRTAAAAGRLTAVATRRLGRGGGTAVPGLLAGRLAPDLTAGLARTLGRGVLTVTGTNGKTTTAHLLTAIVREAGLDPVTNSAGSNMERGVLSALLEAGDVVGRVHRAPERIAVLEVDEASLPGLLPALQPRVALFLNLFRDQLDRYGEVHGIATGWHEMLRADASGMTLVLNADDPTIAELSQRARGEVLTFGLDDPAVATASLGHGADARFSPDGHRYQYDRVYLGHLGEWRCAEESRSRPPLDVAARDVRLDADGTAFTLVVRTPATGSPEATERCLPVRLPLAGLYSVYNALAAVCGAHALGIDPEIAVRALEAAAPAFGRQERFELRGREVRILLAKNPTGLTEVLRTLRAPGRPLHLLAMLNDGIQDGQDVSWIYDADLEQLAGTGCMLVASGARADDCALRWHLAGIDPVVTEPHTASALDAALERTPLGGRLDIVATYTAMIEVRESIAALAGISPYWAGAPADAAVGDAVPSDAAPNGAAPSDAALGETDGESPA